MKRTAALFVRYELPAAACLCLLVIGVARFAYESTPIQPGEEFVQGGNPFVEAESADTFKPLSITLDAPDGAQEVSYAVIDGELAEVGFTLDGKSYIARASAQEGDFSGYSDMAIGLGKMFGFDFIENFDYPYCSKSITEFWRRWHISMGTWFRDYVYIPLGGNRKGLAVQLRNIAVVWLLTGFWHGASWNYMLWGVFYGAILIVEKFFLLNKLKKAPAFVGRLYTLFCVAVGWVLFAFEDFGAGFAYLKTMFGGAVFCNTASIYRLLSYLPLLLLCAVAATPAGAKLYHKLEQKCGSGLMTAADTAGIVAMAGISAAYLISGSYNPFLYFRF